MDEKNSVRTLVEDIAKALVDIPNEVVVKELDGEQVTVFELRVAAGRFGQSDRQAGTHRALHPDAPGRGWHKAEPAFCAGNPRVVVRVGS